MKICASSIKWCMQSRLYIFKVKIFRHHNNQILFTNTIKYVWPFVTKKLNEKVWFALYINKELYTKCYFFILLRFWVCVWICAVHEGAPTLLVESQFDGDGTAHGPLGVAVQRGDLDALVGPHLHAAVRTRRHNTPVLMGQRNIVIMLSYSWHI